MFVQVRHGKKVVGRLLHNRMHKAFARWAQFTEESIEMRVKIERSLGKMMNRQMSGAFDRWVEMAEETQSLRRKVGICNRL